jgi:chemotaxis protein CheD
MERGSALNTYDIGRDETDRTLVGVADYEVATEGSLVAYGLGACVGIVLIDRDAGVAGLAHTMLPRATDVDTRAAPVGKFVDTTVEALLRSVVGAGSTYGDIEACLVGGADLFDLEALPDDTGARSVAVAREELAAMDVPVVAAATGEQSGRTVEVDVLTGAVTVSTAADEAGRVIYP